MRIFVVAMPGCGNLGDDLISEILQTNIAKRYPGAELGILCGENSSFGLLNCSIKLFRPRKLPGKFFKRERIIKDYARKSDLIIIGGGGLFQDSHSFFTIHSYLHWIYYASCPVICVGIGAGPIRYKWNNRYLKRTLNRDGVLIQLRDKESFELLSQMGIKRLSYSCDIVEGSKLTIEKRITSKKTLGCSIRQWGDIDIDGVVDLLKSVIEEHNIKCVYFFAFEHSNNSHVEFDFLKRIASAINIETRVLAYGQDNDFIESLQSVDYAIASRYHANIIWQKIGIPIIPIPYAPKVFSLYKKHGVVLYPIDSVLFSKSFVRVRINDHYEMPNCDDIPSISFTCSEVLYDSIVHFCSIISSIFQSVIVKLKH